MGTERTPQTTTPSISESTSALCRPTITERPSCSFGTTYRKNPQHKVDEAHPGDNDYKNISENSEDAETDGNDSIDNRPECEYGMLCYRKNPQHRKDYKHTSKPRAAKRKAAEKRDRVKKTKSDHLSGDSDSYESDFINDDSDLDDKDISSDEEDVDEWKPE